MSEMNLRELLAKHDRTAMSLSRCTGIAPQVIARRVNGDGELNASQMERLSQALNEPVDVIYRAALETRNRPGEKDARGQWKRNQKAAGGANGKSTANGVGMGASGVGSVPANGGAGRDHSNGAREAVPA